MGTAITVEAVKSAWTLDEDDDLVEDEAWCAACGEPFEPDQQALEVYDPLYDVAPHRAIVTIHLPCYQGEELH